MIVENPVFKEGKIYKAIAHLPYDGCSWEPVYGYCYEDGKLDFFWYVKAGDWTSRMKDSVIDAWNYPRKDEEPVEFEYDNIDELFKIAPAHAVAIAKYVAENYYKGAEATCPNCNRLMPADEFEYDDGSLQGLGGVAYTYTDWYCVDCICSNRCDYCGHLILGETDEEGNAIALDEEGRCPACREKKCKFCKEYKDSNYFDEHGVCKDCQDNNIYKEQLDKYNLLVKQIESENRLQLRLGDIPPEPIPLFEPIPEEEYKEV